MASRKKPLSVGGIVSQDGKATAIAPSLVRRVTQGIRYAVTGVGPNDWFGPQQPLQPVAQEQAEGRVLDYRSGYNTLQRPREETESGITFHQLRALSETCNFLRLVIETRKDQMEKLTWAIQPRLKVGQKPSDIRTSRLKDKRIEQIEAFLHKPDAHNNWTTWLRQLVEEVLVTDAVTIYRRRNKGGDLYALQQLDGATIKRIIDDQGLTPAPPDVAYQQILHGVTAVDYTADQLLYLPRNRRIHRLYGYSPVEQVVMTVNIALRRTMAQLNYFTEGNIPEALISVPPTWTPAQVMEMQQSFDEMLRGNLAERSGAKFVPGGLGVQFMKEALLKDDFDEWLVRIVCYAFSVSPTPFTKQTNRATAESVHSAALQEGLFPLQNWVKGLVDRVLAEDFEAPDLEFSWNDDPAMDPKDAMAINTGYVAAGLKTRNEVRSELGLDPVADGDEITITAGNTVTRLSDALTSNQPTPAQPNTDPQEIGAEQSPDQPGEKPEAKPVKKADDTAGDDPDPTAPQYDKSEEEMAAILAAFLARIRELMAAKVGAAEPKFSDVVDEIAAAEKAGVFDMDQLYAPVQAALEKRAAEAGQNEVRRLLLPTDERGPPADDGGQAPVPGTADPAEAIKPAPTVSEVAAEATKYVNQDAIDYAQTRAAEMIGKKVVDGKLVDNPDAKWAISDTTRDGIRQLVVDAEKQGQSVQQLAAAIRKSALFSPERAKRIAQWELSYADNNGRLIAWKRSGLVAGKRSILGSEHKICDECDANVKAGVIGLDETFPSGHQCAPYHPSCPCTTAPVLKT